MAYPVGVKLTDRAIGHIGFRAADDLRCRLERRIAAHQRDIAEREVIVEDSCAPADGRGPLPERVPSESKARLEEIVVFLENFRRQSLLQAEVPQLLVDGIVIRAGKLLAEDREVSDGVPRQLLAGN